MSGEKILVVEDNQMNLELAGDLLEARGYRVVQAKGGREALEVAQREQPELILMDLQLPEMDGLEATRLLKQGESTKHIIVVALTAHAMLGDEEKAREAGCGGYIAKPINTRKFAGVIAGFLDKPAEKKEE
ncbi:MAG: response regulator [Actinomycetota bacterium]